ncbi:MAG TPA: hypothetical protein VN364_07370 [Bellilinea sp.]|nr:hypothetical protein [Bellilinea sp.]
MEQPPVEAASANKSVLIVETPTQSNITPLNVGESGSTAVAPQTDYPVSIDSTEYANVLSNLLVKAGDAANSYKPGWLVQTSSKESELTGDNGTLPNGTVIPEAYNMETWVNIDNTATVIQSVSIMTGLDGQIIQVGIQDHGKGWNTATMTQKDVIPPSFITRWENPLREILAQLETEAVTMSRDFLNGSEVIYCSVFTFFPQPLQVNGVDEEIVSSEVVHWIDSATGLVLQIDIFSTTVSGERFKAQSTTYSPIEPVAAPDPAVLEYLEETK